MKRMCLPFVVCTLMVMLLCISVSAASQVLLPTSDKTTVDIEDELDWQARLKEAQDYAYLDLETALPEMKEKILSARNTIIFSTDWVADGFTMTVEDPDGNTIRTMPNFSELFPGWDLPVYDIELEQAAKPIEIPV